MKKTASSLTVALLLAAASASAFAQEQPAPTPTFPQEISLTAQRGFTTESKPVFEALGIESTTAEETTEIYLTANGTKGVVNVTGTGSVLKTQQITLGAGTSGLTAFSVATYGENNGKLYWTPKYLATDAQYEDAKARAAEATGTINISDGAKMYVGEGNADRFNNKLQIFNGAVNVDGSGSELILGNNCYLTMDPNYGTLPNGASGQKFYFNNAISVTNGGKVSVADGGKLYNFTAGVLYGERYNVKTDITVSGEGSRLEIEATNGNIFLNYRGDVTSALSSEDGATLRLGASQWISVGDGATIAAAGGTLETTATSGVLLESGAKLVLGDDAVWTASGDVTLASGAEMTVSIATTGTAADITFSENAQLAFKDGATLNLTLGESETLEVLQNKSRIYLGEISAGAPFFARKILPRVPAGLVSRSRVPAGNSPLSARLARPRAGASF